MVKYYWVAISGLLFIHVLSAQKEDVNWVFGNGCGINFENAADPVIFLSGSANHEASASISDSSGQLQFYLANDVLLNQYNDTLVNGADFRNPGTYAGGMVFLPFFNGSHLYHIFHVGEADHAGIEWGYERLYHSVVDMTMNDGRGGVLVKEELLLDEAINEGISAVKHGDGASWWLVLRENGDVPGKDCTNKFFKFLIQGISISGPFVQETGTPDCSRGYPGGRAKFFSKGDRMIYMDYVDQMTELYDFDRCSGELSNPVLLGKNLPAYGAETSPDGRYLYISDQYSQGSSSNLYQYDLLAEDIPGSKETLGINPTGDEVLGQMLLAPNGKIYLSSGPPSILPQYISVINSPDMKGKDCGFKPLHFYLGEDALTFGDLPNMPNYKLPPLGGEPCLTDVYNSHVQESDFVLYPNPVSDYLFFLNMKDCTVIVYDQLGRKVIMSNSTRAYNFIDVSGLANGLYTLVFSDIDRLISIQRFVKQSY